MKILIIILVGVMFCLPNCTNQKPKMEKKEIITKYLELTAFEEKTVWIKGKYTIHNPYPNSKFIPSDLPIKIVLEDGEEVFLEPFWHSSRSSKEIEQFKEHIVCVKGIFYSEMPSDSTNSEEVATMGGACLFPVDSIVLVE